MLLKPFSDVYDLCTSINSVVLYPATEKEKKNENSQQIWHTFPPDVEVICSVSFMSVLYWMCHNFLVLLASPFSWPNSTMSTAAVLTGNNKQQESVLGALSCDWMLSASLLLLVLWFLWGLRGAVLMFFAAYQRFGCKMLN